MSGNDFRQRRALPAKRGRLGLRLCWTAAAAPSARALDWRRETMGIGMLFGGCNCIPGPSFLSAYGSLCAGGAGFVSAVIGAMVTAARTASASKLGREIPEVARLAVGKGPRNTVVQFVHPERPG